MKAFFGLAAIVAPVATSCAVAIPTNMTASINATTSNVTNTTQTSANLTFWHNLLSKPFDPENEWLADIAERGDEEVAHQLVAFQKYEAEHPDEVREFESKMANSTSIYMQSGEKPLWPHLSDKKNRKLCISSTIIWFLMPLCDWKRFIAGKGA